jgi:hypothetical protein
MVAYTHPDVGVLELNDTPFTSDPSQSFFNDYWTRDLFTFEIEYESSINLNLHDISDGDNANLRLYQDTDGDKVLDFGEPLLDTSMKPGSANDTINYRAEAGDYIAVVSYANGNSDPDSYLTYSLDISATYTASNLLPVDEFVLVDYYVGGNFNQIDQSVGDSDTSDVFYFQVPAIPSSGDYPVEIRLDGLSSDADMRLIDDDGDKIVSFGSYYCDDDDEVIASSTNGSNDPEMIRAYLEPGDYYLQVYQFSGDTDYHLEFDAFDYTDRNILVAEEDLCEISETPDPITSFVGDGNPVDTYQFELYYGQLDISLTGLMADADMRVVQDTNDDGIFDYDVDNLVAISDNLYSNSELISLDSNDYSGEFFLQVYQFSGTTNYDLNLNYSV